MKSEARFVVGQNVVVNKDIKHPAGITISKGSKGIVLDITKVKDKFWIRVDLEHCSVVFTDENDLVSI